MAVIIALENDKDLGFIDFQLFPGLEGTDPHCKNIWVTSTIFWSSQLHACCVHDTLQNFKRMLPICLSVVEKLLSQIGSSYESL